MSKHFGQLWNHQQMGKEPIFSPAKLCHVSVHVCLNKQSEYRCTARHNNCVADCLLLCSPSNEM